MGIVRKGYFLIFLGILLTLPQLVFSAPAQKPEAVVIGEVADLSGPVGPTGIALTAGATDYFRYINEKKGGIDGVPIKHVIIDARYNLSDEIAAYKKLVTVDKAKVVFLISSGSASALTPMATDKDKVVIWSSPDPVGLFYPNSYFFSSVPIWADQIIAIFKWWKKNEWKKKEPPRVGLFNFDAQVGWSMAKRLKGYLQRNDIPVVAETYGPGTPTDLTTQVLTLKKGNPDIILGFHVDAGYTAWARDCKRLGLNKPQITHWCSLPQSTMEAEGAGAVGWLSFHPSATMSELNNPAIKLVNKLWKEDGYRKSTENTAIYFMGWVRAACTVKVIQDLVNEKGWQAVTGENIKLATEQLKGYTAEGAIPPTSFSKDQHWAYHKTKAVRIVPGAKFIPVTGYLDCVPLTKEEKTVEYYKGR